MGLPTVGHTIAVVAFYLGLALFSMRAVLPAPSLTLVLPADVPPRWVPITDTDQKLLVAQVAFNARALTRAPTTLRDGPQCYPLRGASTLGEHAFGAGLLGVVPYLLTGGDPVLTYNAVVVIALMLAGVGMHLLVRNWTGSGAAALVAGALFATNPIRLGDLQHLYIVANHWTPFALLAAERLFSRRTWGAAVALALFVGLQILESIYPLMVLALIGGVFGVWLMLRHRRSLARLVPKLVVALAPPLLFAVAVLGPYLATRALWGTLGGRKTALLMPTQFWFGHEWYAGTGLAVLALVALGDRLRGRRIEWAGDPRLALVLGGGLVAWAALAGIWIPGLGYPVPSLFVLLARVIPGFDALRAAGTMGTGVTLVTAILGGFGMAVLTRGLGARARGTVGVVVLVAALAEVFVPAIARGSFGRTVTLVPRKVRPPDPVIALYGGPADGGVLDMPHGLEVGVFRFLGEYTFLSAYHHRPVAACYNSFHVLLQDDIIARAARLGNDPRAADALVALGIRDAMVHRWFIPAQGTVPMPTTAAPQHLRLIGNAMGRSRYTLVSTAPITEAWAPLAAGAAHATDLAPVVVAPGATEIPVRVANAGAATYRQPDPIEPVPVVARWLTDAGELVREERGRHYLAASLAAGETIERRLTLTAPTVPGRYRLTIAPVAEPETVVAVALVEVRA